MFVDSSGALWLSDPSTVFIVLGIVVGLTVWCHRWLETGEMPAPRSMAIRMRTYHRQPRTLRERLVARQDALAAARMRRDRQLLRTRQTPQAPMNAA
ncbi:MAG: hypothetical protein AB7P40_17270 [Chloroflexota bacterium]